LYREWKRRGKETRARGEVTQSPKKEFMEIREGLKIWELDFVGRISKKRASAGHRFP
jgi:hypothetical protein